jgi:integrase
MQYQGLRLDPLLGFAVPRQSRRGAHSRPSDQETYLLNEVRQVLALNRPEDSVWLAYVVAIFTGLRAFEIHALRWDAIDWTTKTLRVARGKGAKVRHVPLQAELHDFLRHLGGPDTDRPRIGPMFTFTKHRVDVADLRPLLDDAGVTWDRGTNEITGLPRRLTWHACRRTYAAASLAAGVDSLEIQRSLGHAEMDMTGEYTGAFARWKAVVQTEAWPRGRLCMFGPYAGAVPAVQDDRQMVR